MSTLVYVHGTNGSGKSTLARAVIAAAGGQTLYDRHPKLPRAASTHTARGVTLLGRYRATCGGVDLIAPYQDVLSEIQRQRKTGHETVFAEGLITPGVETCTRMAMHFLDAHFIHLDTPEEQCHANMLARRKRMGKADQPYDPRNIYSKARSARSWVNNLQRSGLNAYGLQFKQARETVFHLLGLTEPTVDDILGI
jgi:hypothetical protein